MASNGANAMSVSRVGIAGLGRMGRALATRLLECRVALAVWNRTPGPERELVAKGALAVESPTALVQTCQIVVTSLANDQALEAVYSSQGGLLSGSAAGRLFIDTSTVLPATARRVAEHAKRVRAAFVDAPVLGTVAPARAGQLIVMVGGSEADVLKARAVLNNIARVVHHVGDVGSGAAMKVAVNIPVMAWWAALADSFKVAQACRLNPDQFAAIIGDSPAALAQLRLKMPILLGQSAEVGFDINGVLKLCDMMNQLAQTTGICLPSLEATREMFAAAAQGGWGERDVAALPRFRPPQE
jgi:3-hydroxyisobutyrate dehydrogenase